MKLCLVVVAATVAQRVSQRQKRCLEKKKRKAGRHEKSASCRLSSSRIPFPPEKRGFWKEEEKKISNIRSLIKS
jgi:hypothetical protein